jgi:heme-degrading monooxygenase HmoA
VNGEPRFVAVYRWVVDPEQAAAFERWWREGTDALKAHGSFGSTLAREGEGHYIGIALWPSAAARGAAFAARADAAPAPGLIEFAELSGADLVDLRWSL